MAHALLYSDVSDTKVRLGVPAYGVGLRKFGSEPNLPGENDRIMSLRQGGEPELQSVNDVIEQSIPERFEEIVRTYPDRLAIKMGERSLSYGELNRYANRIARAILEKRGPGSEPIALLFDHGIEVIAAIFGVLKAGKFFVALDPAFPVARMNLLAADSQAKLIVTNNRSWSRSPLVSNIVDATLDVNKLDCGVPDENLGIAISPATISSIMYTSGSTGTPKGVIDTHANILESSRLLAQRVHLISDDRLTLLHMLTYGSGRTNVYLSLLNGASLFPFDVRDEGPEHLAEWLNCERITILYCPVALFRRFAALHAGRIPLTSLRLVHLSGAPISRHDFELYKKCFDVSLMTHDPWSNKFPREEVEQSIPARFAKIVNQFPDRIAIKDKDRVVTYAGLNDLANRVAQTVMSQRPMQAEAVGIFIEKGIVQCAAMLGVLKAGKFFVLLDPALPPFRIAALLNDSEAKLVISDERHVEILRKASSTEVQFMVFESIGAVLPASDPGLAIAAKECAFLVYTSGSTGQPKGVIQTHRNLLHRVMLRSSDCGLEAHDRMTLLPAGTSNAITNAFTALLMGATLCPFDVKKEGVHRLADWLVQEEISICLISSTLFRSLCQILSGSENFPHLRFLRIRSESAYKADFDLFKRHFSSDCVLVHGLSSTETGPVCEYPMNHSSTICSNGLPVGYALEDKDILLFDDSGRELGPNKIGEIVVRSRYLSPGYWRRPDLTKEKFAPDPRDPEKQLYHTGDLGLMLPDGCLIHKGRKDFRVKIRGYGVEIAEVEKVLRGHPAVHDTVVMARDNESREARLIAYFTSSPERAPTTSELRKFLGKTLPDYMVPAVFVRLEALPLTPNGKVDRKALPEPGTARPELETAFQPPRTSDEGALSTIWSDVLGLDRIGSHDNFFDLGGHSLGASRIISRVIRTFQLELPLKALFQSPTIAEMAAVITEYQERKLGDDEVERILEELESMSDEEAQHLAAKETVR